MKKARVVKKLNDHQTIYQLDPPYEDQKSISHIWSSLSELWR